MRRLSHSAAETSISCTLGRIHVHVHIVSSCSSCKVGLIQRASMAVLCFCVENLFIE